MAEVDPLVPVGFQRQFYLVAFLGGEDERKKKAQNGGCILHGLSFAIKIEEKRAKRVKELQTVPCRRPFPRVVSGILNWHPPTPCVKLSVIFTP
jgi:hypothetical protein